MSISTTTLPPPLTHHSPDQLCYVHCTRCDTVLAVSVPCTSLLKTVTVRCGHCTNLLPVNILGMMLQPPVVNQFHSGHSFFTPFTHGLKDDQISNGCSNFVMKQNHPKNVSMQVPKGFDDLSKLPVIRRPPEKKQRVPSAYNRFMKEEIQRIKTRNPDISHREAFSAAAKNWAHFPHIRFGLMAETTNVVPAATVNKISMRQQEIDGGFMNDNLFAAAASLGVSPYY